jgi:hypothetical protein
MYQNIDNAEYAERQLNLGSATLGANKDWANAKAGTQLGLSVIGVGAALADPDGDSRLRVRVRHRRGHGLTRPRGQQREQRPTLDDIYIQIREVQHQIQAMQTQLNERFDIVEQKLDTVFETMVNGFDLLASGQLDIRGGNRRGHRYDPGEWLQALDARGDADPGQRRADRSAVQPGLSTAELVSASTVWISPSTRAGARTTSIPPRATSIPTR